MLRIVLYIFIFFDLAVVAAKNLAVRNVHLDPATRHELASFNTIALSLLILVSLILLFLFLFPRKPRKSSWPHSPPD